MLAARSADTRSPSQPTIVHVASASGSGKTYLGELLQTPHGDRIAVKDTDEFYQHHAPLGGNPPCLEMWLRARTAEIETFVAANRTKPVIVFVGLLDHAAPAGEFSIAMDRATVRFFIEITDADLLRQYYTRVLAHARANPALWHKLAAGRDKVDSSAEKLRENRESARAHCASGYVLASPGAILAHVAGLLVDACGSDTIKRAGASDVAKQTD